MRTYALGIVASISLLTASAFADGGATPAAFKNIEEVDASPSCFGWQIKVTADSLTDNGDGTCTLSFAAGTADITSVGDVVSGAAFDGTQGTILTFNNAGGDATIDYDGTDFSFSKPVSVTGADTLTLIGTDPGIIFNVGTAGDTDFWSAVNEDAGNDDDDSWQVGKGTTIGTTPFLSLSSIGNLTIDGGTGSFGVVVDGSTGGATMYRDTDDAGWTECVALDGILTCGIDANGIPDGTP